MLRAHLDGLLAWTRLRVSKGALEGHETTRLNCTEGGENAGRQALRQGVRHNTADPLKNSRWATNV
jgi:hypothetical protein